MRNKKLKASSGILLSSMALNATAVEIFNNGETDFNLNGNVSVYYLQSDQFNELNDGFSRFYFDTSHKLTNDFKAVAKLEWGVQVSNTDSLIIVNNNGLTSTGPTEDIIWLRQGYVGISNEKFGTLTLGKQWSVTYDITGVTDVFDVFGAEASGVYNLGTDGGYSGSGRTEQAIKYTHAVDDFTFGLQYQATEEQLTYSGNSETPPNHPDLILNFTNGYAFSAIYQAPYKIGLGVGYSQANISLARDGISLNAENINDSVVSAHITYSQLRAPGLHVAVVFTDMENHETNDAGDVMKSASGIEVHASYRFDNDIAPIFGYNSLKDNSSATLLKSGKFHKEYFIVGAKYHWIEDAHLYAEIKIDASTASTDDISTPEDAIGIGMAYMF